MSSESEGESLGKRVSAGLQTNLPEQDGLQVTETNNSSGQPNNLIDLSTEQTKLHLLQERPEIEDLNTSPYNDSTQHIQPSPDLEQTNTAGNVATISHALPHCTTDSPRSLTLKVRVDDSALKAGHFRRSHTARVRRPTEKVRQNHEMESDSIIDGNGIPGIEQTTADRCWGTSSNQQDPIPSRAISAARGRGRGRGRSRGRGRPRSSVNRRRSAPSRKARNQAEDSDYDARPRRQRRKRPQILAAENNGDIQYTEENSNNRVAAQEVTIADFETPTPYGFPMHVVRRGEGDTEQTFVAQPASKGNLSTILPYRQNQVLASSSGSSTIQAGPVSTVQQEQAPRPIDEYRALLQTTPMPNTPEFWMDWFLAEQAYKSQNLDFKQMCLNMMKAQEKAMIPKITVHNPLAEHALYFFGRRIELDAESGSGSGSNGKGNGNGNEDSRGERIINLNPRVTLPNRIHQTRRIKMTDLLPPYGLDCRKHPNNPNILLTDTDWDVVLASVKIARKEMFMQRRWKMNQKSIEAGWAVWAVHRRTTAFRDFAG